MAPIPVIIPDARVSVVQIDSLVVMKIAKHVDSEFYSGLSELAGDTCQGILTGLVSIEDKRLEVTNCFPTPRPEVVMEGEESAQSATQAEDKQIEILDMLKRFRSMNIDYELVGFYQAHNYGACFNQDVFESLIDYQSSLHDGVVLIYDPVKTRQGQLTIRAFHLTTKALELSLNKDWSPEEVKQAGLTFGKMIEELPVVIKSSHLMSVMLAELALSPKIQSASHLELGTRRNLEKSMRSMMNDIDELNKSVGAYNKYVMEKQKYDTVYNSLIQKRELENQARAARNEPPLPFDDIKRQFKQPQLPNGMLEIFLNSLDTDAHANYAADASFQQLVTGENIAKLFVSESAAERGTASTEKDRSVSVTR